jgi:hypothetical protein
LIQEKTRTSTPKNSYSAIGKKSISPKFPSSLARKTKTSFKKPSPKSTDGEASGRKGTFIPYFRGVGELKLLQNKQSKLIRVLVRAEKTHKVVMNHLLQAKDIFCKLEQLKTSNNAWTWAAYDVSDEKPATEKFCAKFTSKEEFEKFKEEFEKACESNGKVLAEMKAKEEGEEKQ